MYSCRKSSESCCSAAPLWNSRWPVPVIAALTNSSTSSAATRSPYVSTRTAPASVTLLTSTGTAPVAVRSSDAIGTNRMGQPDFAARATDRGATDCGATDRGSPLGRGHEEGTGSAFPRAGHASVVGGAFRPTCGPVDDMTSPKLALCTLPPLPPRPLAVARAPRRAGSTSKAVPASRTTSSTGRHPSRPPG